MDDSTSFKEVVRLSLDFLKNICFAEWRNVSGTKAFLNFRQ